MQNRQKIHTRIRKVVSGTAERPRLATYRSLNNLFIQAIDDVSGKTLFAANSLKLTGSLTKKAEHVGTEIAKLAKENKIKHVVFDRGGFPYKGVIVVLADAARKEGLEF